MLMDRPVLFGHKGRKRLVEVGAIVDESSQRTTRLEGIVDCLDVTLSGRSSASFAKRLRLSVSNDTLLRAVRRLAQRPTELLRDAAVDN